MSDNGMNAQISILYKQRMYEKHQIFLELIIKLPITFFTQKLNKHKNTPVLHCNVLDFARFDPTFDNFDAISRIGNLSQSAVYAFAQSNY